jgi:hypothetical protein
VSKIAKTEKTVLRPKNYDRNSDFAIVLEEMKKEFETSKNIYISLFGDPEKHEADAEFYKKTKMYENIYKKVESIKNSLDIGGKIPQDVARDFSKLNYLIDFRIDDRSCGDECCIPKEKTFSPSNDEEIEIAEAEAFAKMILLKLLK